MADEFHWTLARTPAGLCTMVAKIGENRILVSQNATHQVQYQDECRRTGKPFRKGLRLPCAMWIFGVCWTHQKIYTLNASCEKCDQIKNELQNQAISTPPAV